MTAVIVLVMLESFLQVQRWIQGNIPTLFEHFSIFIMSYDFRKFSSKSKVVWRSLVPILYHEWIRHPIKGGINFYEIENLRIISQPLRIFNIQRIERALP